MDTQPDPVFADPPPLPHGISLRLWNQEGEMLFEDSGKWLHPLFQAEDFLALRSLDAATLLVQDRIAGSAAALLACRMGFRQASIQTVSRGALAVFRKNRVHCRHHVLVERIDCRTEDMVSPDSDPEAAYRMLKGRAGRIHGKALTVRGLYAGYGGEPVLKGLDLDLGAGEQLVVTGGNGAGKTTLLKCLIGSLRPAGGQMQLGDAILPPRGPGPSPVGYVHQGIRDRDFPVTAGEIVSTGLLGQKLSFRDRALQAEVAMRDTGCFHLAQRNLQTLSGGERQRVALARCMAQKPALILLDEPTSFLDRNSREEFRILLGTLVRRQGPTILLVSHDREWVDGLGWPRMSLEEGKLWGNS